MSRTAYPLPWPGQPPALEDLPRLRAEAERLLAEYYRRAPWPLVVDDDLEPGELWPELGPVARLVTGAASALAGAAIVVAVTGVSLARRARRRT